MKSIIHTDEENHVVLSLIERLMEEEPEKESDEGKLLGLLADAVQIFEQKNYNK